MFWTRRKHERREPVLAAGSLFDLKLDPRDRAGGPLQTARPNSAPGGAKPPSPKKRKPRRKKPRPLTLRRLFYWCVVLGIWAAVALGVGAFGWARQNQAANDFSSGGCRTNPRATITTVPGASRSIADCQNLESKVNSNYRLELIGLVGAGVLAAAGLVLWITEPTPPVSDTTALSCTPELTLALAPRLTCQLRF